MRVCFLLPGLMLLTAGLPARAAEPEPRVNVSVRRIALVRVLDMATRGSNVRFSVDPSVAVVPVTIQITDQPASEAVKAIFEAAQKAVPDLRMEVQNGIRRISLKPGGQIPPLPRALLGTARAITVSVRNLTLREALTFLFQSPDAPQDAGKPRFEVERDVPDVRINFTFTHDSERVMVRLLLRQARTVVPDLAFEEKDGRYVIGVRPGQKEGGRAEQDEFDAPPQPNLDRRLVLALHEVPLRQAVSAVLELTLPWFDLRQAYEVDELVPNTPISLNLVTTRPEEALELLQKALKEQVKTLEIRNEGDKLRLIHSPL
jgi:hypothetical protein